MGGQSPAEGEWNTLKAYLGVDRNRRAIQNETMKGKPVSQSNPAILLLLMKVGLLLMKVGRPKYFEIWV